MMKTSGWMGGVGRRAPDDDAGCVARSEGWLWIPMTIGGSRIAFVGVMRARTHRAVAMGGGRWEGSRRLVPYDLRPMYSRPIRREDCRDSRDDGDRACDHRRRPIAVSSPYHRRRPITVSSSSSSSTRRARGSDAKTRRAERLTYTRAYVFA